MTKSANGNIMTWPHYNRRWRRHNTVPLSLIRSTVTWRRRSVDQGGTEPARPPPCNSAAAFGELERMRSRFQGLSRSCHFIWMTNPIARLQLHVFVSDVVLVETHCNLDHLCLFLLLLHPSPPDRELTIKLSIKILENLAPKRSDDLYRKGLQFRRNEAIWAEQCW